MTCKTIVVPLDGSDFAERAIQVAVALADRMHGSLLLASAPYRGPLKPREYLEERAAALRASACKVDVQVLSGNSPSEGVLEAAAELDDAVICMTTHGRGRLRWALLGSVAEEVVEGSTQPVVLVGRHCRDDFLIQSSHMLVASDVPDASVALAPTATGWARELGLTLDLAVVVHPLDVVSAEHENELLDALRAPFASIETATMLTDRSVERALVDYANVLPAAMVAINVHGHDPLNRVALGSVTMGVAHLASCPLLVVPGRRD